MKNKYIFVIVMLAGILMVSLGLTTIYVRSTQEKTDEDGQLMVVTSFYPMYIAALNIIDGAEGVTLENLSEPQTGCLHDYQLTPADMLLLSEADVFIVNGGGIESFLTSVADSYPSLVIVEASEEVELLTEEEEEETDAEEDHGESGDHEHGETNAHAWMSVSAYRTQVATIAQYMMEIDPEHADVYEENAICYDQKLAELEAQQESLREEIAGQKVILFHEAYAYVAADYGLSVAYLLDLDEERQVSAGEVADVLDAIRDNDVKMILAEELYGSDMGDTVQREADVTVLYLDALNRGDYSADSYLTGMQENIDRIREAFQ